MRLPVGYSWSVVRMRRTAQLDCITPLNLFSVRSCLILAGFKSIVVLYRNIGRLLPLMRIDQIIAHKGPWFAAERTLDSLADAGYQNGFEGLPLSERVAYPGTHGFPDATFDFIFARA